VSASGVCINNIIAGFTIYCLSETVNVLPFAPANVRTALLPPLMTILLPEAAILVMAPFTLTFSPAAKSFTVA